ncbi:uncharacterized protein LOC127988218 isoform X2 [Carassius gibelio]|uniref:uncharacterized protein LOC127988218 isoform X2 n=1 Tax=Carassius gibelio TaxID=101364 RepID=UPI002279C5FB|nr:uncharacterized protein LOC127988218 isoform X2 [Carassius gibelio]
MKCLNIMKIMQLQLYLFIWCRAAETLTDHLTDLGQNVTINCDLDETDVNWLLLKLPDPPVLILLSFNTSATFYYSKTFQQKYSVSGYHRLFINNVTLDDLGLYYCVTSAIEKYKPPKYSDGTRLHITEATPDLEIQDHTVVKYIEKNQTHLRIITYISAFINALLIVVFLGLIKLHSDEGNRDDLKQSEDTIRQNLQVLDFEPQDSTQTLICYEKI